MRLFILFGSLLVIALIAALVVPPYVDWNQYRDNFEQEATKVLGQPVQVRGQTSVRFLPLPSITFSDVSVGHDDAPILTAENFQMDIELAPLLKGDVVVVDMVLDHPLVELGVDGNGRVLWKDFAKARPAEFEINQVSLESISVNEGVLRYRDQRHAREVILKNINIVASADTLTGPWYAEGLVQYGEEPYRVSGSTGRWLAPGEMHVKVDVEPKNSPYDFSLSGPLKIIEKVPSFDGSLKIRAIQEQTDKQRRVFPRPAHDTALPVRLEADLNLAPGGASIPAFEIDIGSRADPYKLVGTGQVVFADTPTFRLRLEGQQINVDRFTQKGGKEEEADKPSSVTDKIAAALAVLNKVPRIEADGEANLHLPAIVAGDTVIRDVGVDLRPAKSGTGWRLSNLEAQFPGRTDFRADGVLDLGETIGYTGDLLIASRQPSGLAKWLGVEANSVIRGVSNAGLSASVAISNRKVEFDELELILDSQVLKGRLVREVKDGQKPLITAELSGDGVNFDQANAVAGVLLAGTDVDGTSILGQHDLSLNLNAKQLSASGVIARSVAADISYVENKLDVKSVEIADLAGAAISLKGQLDTFPSNPNGSLTGSFNAENPSRFLQMLKKKDVDLRVLEPFIENSAVVSDTSLTVNLEAHGKKYQIDAQGSAGRSEIDFNLSGSNFNIALEEQMLDGRLVLTNDSAADLMSQLGLPVLPLDAGGRAAFRTVIKGVAKSGLRTEGALTMRDGYLSGEGVVSIPSASGAGKIKGSVDVKAEIQDLDPFILLSGLPVPGFGEGQKADINGILKLDGDQVALSVHQGTFGGAGYSGHVSLELSGKSRPSIAGELVVKDLDFPTLVGLVFTGTSTEKEPVGSDEGRSTVAKPLLSGLDGKLKLRADTISLPFGMGEAKAGSADLTISDGDIVLDGIKSEWAGGLMTGAVNIAQSTNARLLNGELKLDGGDLETVIAAAGFEPFAKGKFDSNFSFESTGSSDNALLSELTGSGTLFLSPGTINGLDDDGFGKIIQLADAMVDDALIENADNLLTKNAFSGDFSYQPSEFNFSLGAGIARADGVKLANEKMSAVGNARIDLKTGVALVDAKISYAEGKQSVTGATPDFALNYRGGAGSVEKTVDTGLFSTYLNLRLSEERQRQFEAQQSEILERQRLSRSVKVIEAEAVSEAPSSQ